MVGITILSISVKYINIELREKQCYKGLIYLKIIYGNIIITVKHDLQLFYVYYIKILLTFGGKIMYSPVLFIIG